VATAPGVRMWEADDHTSEGEVIVPGDPAANYAAVADYAKWTKVFSDVARVEDQGPATDVPGEEKVLLVTTAGQNNNLRFRNDPAQHVVRFHDTGGAADVWAEISFEPASGGATRVHARLHADVHGLMSLFVTDRRLRDDRQKKLASDLADIQKYFRK
jgi:carbon monoxide dehydrogenase subunit G